MAHTPGPWSYHHNGRYFQFGADDVGQLGDVCASCVDEDIPDGDAEDNARLIAAAPDLLEAARAALSASSLSESEPGGINILAVEEMLRAAIAKAEGR